MKRKDIQDLVTKEVKELRTMIKEQRELLMKSRLDHSMGKLKDTRSLSRVSDDIARIMTELQKKEAQNGKKV